MFVVDTSDKVRIGQAKYELHKMLDQVSLQGVPVLIVGNKVDLVAHLREPEIIERRIKRTQFGLSGKEQMGRCYDFSIDGREFGGCG